MKKGQIWISAVLYIALGVVAISLILTAGIPLMNKMKDRNTVIQTRDIFTALDNAIMEVRNEGVGSRRVLPIMIKGGTLLIDSSQTVEELRWKMKTEAWLVEPCPERGDDKRSICDGDGYVLKEGNTYQYQTSTIVEDEYEARLEIIYLDKVDLETNNVNPLSGRYSIAIENQGSTDPLKPPKIYLQIS